MTIGTLSINKARRTSALSALAKRVIWFEPPEKALADPVRFLCYLMARPTPEDLAIAARYFRREDFVVALRNAPPGLFTVRAWRYWNLVLEGHTRRPLPRRFPDVEPVAPYG